MYRYEFIESNNPDVVVFEVSSSFHLASSSIISIMRGFNIGRFTKVDSVRVFNNTYKLL